MTNACHVGQGGLWSVRINPRPSAVNTPSVSETNAIVVGRARSKSDPFFKGATP
jgi:hypothetical protein